EPLPLPVIARSLGDDAISSCEVTKPGALPTPELMSLPDSRQPPCRPEFASSLWLLAMTVGVRGGGGAGKAPQSAFLLCAFVVRSSTDPRHSPPATLRLRQNDIEFQHVA